MSRHTGIPRLYAAAAKVAGLRAAQILARAFGGRRVYVRTQLLVPLLGEPAAQRVVAAIGAGRHEFPKWTARAKGKRDEALRAAAQDGGDSCRALADAFAVSTRTAQRTLRAPTPPKRKPMARYVGTHHATARRFVQAPDLSDWLELFDEISIVRGLGGITERDASHLSEEWERLGVDHARLRAWQSAELTLLDLQRRRGLA